MIICYYDTNITTTPDMAMRWTDTDIETMLCKWFLFWYPVSKLCIFGFSVQFQRWCKCGLTVGIEKTNDGINITLINDGLPEYYTLTDYDVTVYDWDDTNTDCLQKFRGFAGGLLRYRSSPDVCLNPESGCTNTDCLQKFRDKMLLYFGNDYATNYLRNHI